jgi:hypothetical protein
MRRVRNHLTYANVMATLAVFIALAGGAYAVTKINGSQIKDHTIAGDKLKQNAVVPRARISDRTAALLVSHTKAQRSALRADEGGDAGSSGGWIRMSVGDTVTVLQKDPFTFTAACTGDPNGTITLDVYVTSTVDGWLDTWTGDGVLPSHDAGEQVSLGGVMSSDKPMLAYRLPAMPVAPDGSGVATGVTFTAIHTPFSDCAIYSYAIA